ncbi:transposable element Tcb1 transposase [Trichonephila clavipes]|nr:transposable element Tcb1 transposase [Trichonephila clavipes]
MPVLNLDLVDLASSNPALAQKKARICVGLGMAQARDFEIDIPPSDVVERSNHWEVGGRPQCDKCGCRVRNCSQHRFTTLETISNYGNSYPGDSVVVVHEEPHPQMTGTLSYRPEETGGRQREKSLDAQHRRLDDRYRVLPFYRVLPARWWSVCKTPYESRFSLSSDSHRILIWRERGSRNHPSNIIERDRYGGRGVLVWGGIMLGSRTDLHIFDAGSVNGTRYCNEILLPYVRLFRGAMGLQFFFMDDNAPCHRTGAAEQFLDSEDIERRRLAARTLPPVTIRELRLTLQDEWAAMPQQLIDTLILSMGRRCETCLAVQYESGNPILRRHIPDCLRVTTTVLKCLVAGIFSVKDYAQKESLCVSFLLDDTEVPVYFGKERIVPGPDSNDFRYSSRLTMGSDSSRLLIWNKLGTRLPF